MDRAEIEKILELATDTDAESLTVLSNAWEEKFAAYRADNSKKNLSEWQAAEKALRAKALELTAKYVDAPGTRVLADRQEAWRYLQSEGYKVGRQTVYNAAATGKLIVQPDGTVNESDALAYAARSLKKSAAGARGGKDEKVQSERAAEELALTRVRREKLEFECAREQGLYLLKSDVRAEIAMKIATLEAGIKHFFRTFVADWIHRVGGDPKHTRMAIDWFNAELDALLNEFGRLEDIGVVVIKGGDDGGAPIDVHGPDGGIFADDADSHQDAAAVVGES